MFFDFARKHQFAFQDPASPIAEGIINLHNDIFWWLIVIFVPVVVIFIRILIKSSNLWDNPKNVTDLGYRKTGFWISKIIHGTVLEIVWTITPTIILVLIAIPSFGLIYAMDAIIDPDWTIKVIGNQWYWTFDFTFSSFLMGDFDKIYLASITQMLKKSTVIGEVFAPIGDLDFRKSVVEKSIKLWSHNVKHYVIDSYMLSEESLTKGVRLLSVDNPLVLPVHNNVRILITSSDVLHSFAVPSLGVKLDATPGRLGAIPLFIERPGQFFGQCSELCGVQHGFMPLEIISL